MKTITPIRLPDHALSGSYKQVFGLAFPIVISHISQTIMTVVDTAMVGRLGSIEVASVGLAGILSGTAFAFCFGFLNSVNTYVAQYYGAKEIKTVAIIGWQGLYLAFLSYLLLLIFGYLAPTIFGVMNPSDSVQQLGTKYAQIRLWGGIGIVTVIALSGFMRGVGDTLTPMYIGIIANVINFIFDYLLIFGHFGFPCLEVEGAAVATVISGVVAAIILLVIFLSRRNDQQFRIYANFRFSSFHTKRLFKTGLPMGLQSMLEIGNFAVFSAMIGRMSNEALAANTTAITLLHASFMPLVGISLAATTLVGQYIGAGQLSYARKSGYTAIKIAIAYNSLMAILFATIPTQLLSILTSDPEVIRLGGKVLLVAAVFQLLDGCGICSRGALQGAGDTLFPMVVGLVCGWVVFLPLAYWFGRQYGIAGAWAGAAVNIILRGVIYFLRFRGQSWEKIKI